MSGTSSSEMVRKTLRGALAIVSATVPVPRLIIFQYNPETMSRTVAPQMTGADRTNRSAPLLYTGAPIETINLEIEIDAGDQDTMASGPPSQNIVSQLAALEILLYPGSMKVAANELLLAVGTIEITPYTAPTVLFIWGPQRVMPVRIQSYSVKEEAFDGNLKPIRAHVTLSLQVLTYSELTPTDGAYAIYMAYQVTKEMQAAFGYSQNPSQALDLVGVQPPSV
jgi:hypothetical protein